MKIRIYYEDTDCGNVVYYANYLRYMERSRTELLREKDVHLNQLQQTGLWFVVAEAHVKYFSSARYDDLLDIQSKVITVGGASVEIESEIKNEQDQIIVTGIIKLGCVNSEGKPARIPADIRARITS